MKKAVYVYAVGMVSVLGALKAMARVVLSKAVLQCYVSCMGNGQCIVETR